MNQAFEQWLSSEADRYESLGNARQAEGMRLRTLQDLSASQYFAWADRYFAYSRIVQSILDEYRKFLDKTWE